MSSDDIKKFVSIININENTQDVESKKDITSPVLNIDKNANPSMLGKYFKTVEEEIRDKKETKQKEIGLLAERVANNINKRLNQTHNPRLDVKKSAKEGSKKLLKKEDINPTPPKPQNVQAWKLGQKTGSGVHRDKKREQKAGKEKHKKPYTTEEFNPTDTVKTDVPLLIRLLEYAREDAKTDMDLHNVAEKLIELGKGGQTLTMNHYDQIVGDQKLLPDKTHEPGSNNEVDKNIP